MSLQELELDMLEGRPIDHDRYREVCTALQEQGNEIYLDQIRYAMTIADKFMETPSLGYMFVGGLGVLTNLVNVVGEKAIPEWRGTKDIDLMISHRAGKDVVESSFDEIDISGRSLSIPGKFTVRGYSTDFEGNPVSATSVDVYVPANGNREINIQDTEIGEDHWDRAPTAYFFGLPMKGLCPIGLLETKLTSLKLRGRDCKDVANLIGVLETTGRDPDEINRFLSPRKKQKLKEALTHFNPDHLVSGLESTKKFRRLVSR